MSASKAMMRAVILTAIPIEYQAVCAHLKELQEEIYRGTVYQRGIFLAGNQLWNIAVVETGAGNTPAAVATERAISYFEPDLILFVGVAGGLKDVKIGDVVVATKVYSYSSGKATVAFETRPEVGQPTFYMEQRARAEAKKADWLQRIVGLTPDAAPRVFVAPIAAGDSIIASTRSSLWKFLRANYSDAIAVEMEGYGFLQAARANSQLEALSIRGISDLINNKHLVDAKNIQGVAAQHASAFAFELLAKVDYAHFQQRKQQLYTNEIFQIGNASGLHEDAEHKQEDPIAPPEVPSANQQEMGKTLSKYYMYVKNLYDLFDRRQDIYQDQCERTIGVLNMLDQSIQQIFQEKPAPRLFLRMTLGNIQNQVREVRSELHVFRHLCPLTKVKTNMQRQHYEQSYRNILSKCRSILRNLEQLVLREE